MNQENYKKKFRGLGLKYNPIINIRRLLEDIYILLCKSVLYQARGLELYYY